MITHGLTAAAATLALGATLATGTAQAATVGHPSARGQLHTLMGACVHGETFGIDNRTYVCRQVPAAAAGHYPTRGYARTCRAFARWQAAGLPSARQTRTLARDAVRLGKSLPNDVLRSDVSALILTMTAGTNGSVPAMRVAHDCDQTPR